MIFDICNRLKICTKCIKFHKDKNSYFPHARSKNRSCYQKVSLATKLQIYMPCKLAVKYWNFSIPAFLVCCQLLCLTLLIICGQISRHNLNFQILRVDMRLFTVIRYCTFNIIKITKIKFYGHIIYNTGRTLFHACSKN